MHRDIKPENIIFKTDNLDNIILIDYGFACFEGEMGEVVRCGTPGFVAPEILREEEYDKRVDIYSVGIVFWLLLVGDIPFHDDDFDSVV